MCECARVRVTVTDCGRDCYCYCDCVYVSELTDLQSDLICLYLQRTKTFNPENRCFSAEI